jgi:hypothetical protein
MPADPQIHELEPQPAVVEHAVTDRAGMTSVIDSTFARLFAGLELLGHAPAGQRRLRSRSSR